jgi:hypothetical protein
VTSPALATSGSLNEALIAERGATRSAQSATGLKPVAGAKGEIQQARRARWPGPSVIHRVTMMRAPRHHPLAAKQGTLPG